MLEEGAPGTPEPARAPGTLTIWLLAAAMAGVALTLVVPDLVASPRAALPGPSWVALLPLFALAEVAVIHVPTQRNAHGHTLREIPAVLGLTFLVPEQYVTAYVGGAVLALVLAARMRGLKLAYNASLFALEAALGVTTYHAILAGGDPLSLRGWAAVLAAVLVTDLVSAAAVTAAISLTEGAFDGEVLREVMTSGTIAAFINTCVALLVATLVIVRPSALPLLAVPVVLLVLAYRVYVTLARGHAQTRLLYRFVDRTSAALSHEDLIEVVLTEAAELMHAERAFLVELGADDDVRVHGSAGARPRSGAAAGTTAWWQSALDAGVVRHEATRHARGEDLDAETDPLDDPRDGLAAELRGDGATRFVLVVCDRSFEKETFSSEDVEVFEALAAHAGVALERARGLRHLETLAAELSVARDDALAASEAKSLFLANMSHEIRTPLTIMLATAEMLEDTELDEEQRELLERMQRRGGSLRTLVESILDFSRIESGQLQLTTRPFDLHALVDDLADVYEPRATRAGIRFTTRVDPRTPRSVLGDAGRVFQVLGNLLDNGLKFTHEGEVGVTVRVSDDSSWLELLVHDTGIGIAAEDQAAVFEVFSQVDPSATRRYEGTGLGLAICRQLAALMGGTVAVDSRLGAGSTFTVRLPLVEALAPVGPVGQVGQVPAQVGQPARVVQGVPSLSA